MSNNILIVEDETDFSDVMADILEEYNFFVKTASGVEQALETLDQFKPDLVLLDIKLPYDNEGLDFLHEFRNRPDHSQTPVIILSAKVQLHEISAGMKSGATLYICKPALIGDVIKHINKLLAK